MGESLDEIVEKARVVADATGRDEEDVLADLLDDGIVNDSHRPTEAPKDLITQLKEAAELITTVQEVNAQVSENKVLNGGENRTEVVVETTLDCDIVDRALASAQRKADDLKKLSWVIRSLGASVGRCESFTIPSSNKSANTSSSSRPVASATTRAFSTISSRDSPILIN